MYKIRLKNHFLFSFLSLGWWYYSRGWTCEVGCERYIYKQHVCYNMGINLLNLPFLKDSKSKRHLWEACWCPSSGELNFLHAIIFCATLNILQKNTHSFACWQNLDERDQHSCMMKKPVRIKSILFFYEAYFTELFCLLCSPLWTRKDRMNWGHGFKLP